MDMDGWMPGWLGLGWDGVVNCRSQKCCLEWASYHLGHGFRRQFRGSEGFFRTLLDSGPESNGFSARLGLL